MRGDIFAADASKLGRNQLKGLTVAAGDPRRQLRPQQVDL
jgi:hypothetical protein